MNPHAVNLAVLAGRGDHDKNAFDLSHGVFYGTAFCLAPDVFLTAAHVFRGAAADCDVALARLTPERLQVQPVQDSEVFDDIDLAILACPNLEAEILPFQFRALGFLNDVFSMGFAFGFEATGNPDAPYVYQLRAFKGYIVNRRGLTNLRGVPPGYELSFVPPVGLSGAPLVRALEDGTEAVTGMIPTHHTAEFQDRQMELGLALDIEELLTLESRIVGGSIAERLFRRPRIPPRDRRP